MQCVRRDEPKRPVERLPSENILKASTEEPQRLLLGQKKITLASLEPHSQRGAGGAAQCAINWRHLATLGVNLHISAATAGTCISVSPQQDHQSGSSSYYARAPIGVVRGDPRDVASISVIVPNSLNGKSVQGSKGAEERVLNRTPITLIMYHLNHLEMQCGEYMH